MYEFVVGKQAKKEYPAYIPQFFCELRREERRKRAWSLKEQNWKQQDIAKALGVSEGAVSQWLKRGREGGLEALKAHPPKGVTPRLSPEQKALDPALSSSTFSSMYEVI